MKFHCFPHQRGWGPPCGPGGPRRPHSPPSPRSPGPGPSSGAGGPWAGGAPCSGGICHAPRGGKFAKKMWKKLAKHQMLGMFALGGEHGIPCAHARCDKPWKRGKPWKAGKHGKPWKGGKHGKCWKPWKEGKCGKHGAFPGRGYVLGSGPEMTAVAEAGPGAWCAEAWGCSRDEPCCAHGRCGEQTPRRRHSSCPPDLGHAHASPTCHG